jgi:hypothetical protein
VPEPAQQNQQNLIVVMACFHGGFIGIFGAYREFAGMEERPRTEGKMDDPRSMKLFGARRTNAPKARS